MGSLIIAGMVKLWIAVYQVTRRRPVHQKGEKVREKVLQGGLVQVIW